MAPRNTRFILCLPTPATWTSFTLFVSLFSWIVFRPVALFPDSLGALSCPPPCVISACSLSFCTRLFLTVVVFKVSSSWVSDFLLFSTGSAPFPCFDGFASMLWGFATWFFEDFRSLKLLWPCPWCCFFLIRSERYLCYWFFPIVSTLPFREVSSSAFPFISSSNRSWMAFDCPLRLDTCISVSSV